MRFLAQVTIYLTHTHHNLDQLHNVKSPFNILLLQLPHLNLNSAEDALKKIEDHFIADFLALGYNHFAESIP